MNTQHSCKACNGENLLRDRLTAEKLQNGVTPSVHQHPLQTPITSFPGVRVSMGIDVPVLWVRFYIQFTQCN